MNQYKRPEKETDPAKYPGQIINRPPHFEQPLEKQIEEYRNRKVCASPCMEGKRVQNNMGRWVWTGPCSCYPNAGS